MIRKAVIISIVLFLATTVLLAGEKADSTTPGGKDSKAEVKWFDDFEAAAITAKVDGKPVIEYYITTGG